MKRALIASLCLTFAMTACTSDGGGSESPGEETGSTTGGDGDGDASTTLPGDGDGDTEPVVIGTIDGVIQDINGQPLPSPGLQFCGIIEDDGIPKLCIPIMVAEDGTFHIDAMTAGLWSLKLVHADADGRVFSGQAFQLTMNDGDALEYSDPPIVLPEVTAMTDLAGETTVEIEGGLSITIDPANAQKADFQEPTSLGGVIVDPAHWPWSEVNGETVVQAWGLASFGIKAKEGSFGLAINDALGLEAGAAVNVYEIEKDNGQLHLIATGAVNGDASGLDLTAEGEGLHELSWVVVTAG